MRASLPLLLLLASMSCDLAIPNPDAPDVGDAGSTTPPPSVEDILRDNDCARFTADDFACGGDPTGTWEVVRSCPAAGSWDPLHGTCPEILTEGDGQAFGTVRIDPDGTYTLSLDRIDVALGFSFPLSCYGGATEPCNGANFSGVCELFSDVCECAVDLALQPIVEQGTWYQYRQDLTFRGEGYAYDLQFCRVEPYVMRLVRFAPEPGALTWGLVLRRTVGNAGSELGANPE